VASKATFVKSKNEFSMNSVIIYRSSASINVEHFYYCLLVACRLAQKNMPSDTALRVYINHWLETAENNAIFDNIVQLDLVWLKRSVLMYTAEKFIENLIDIYDGLRTVNMSPL
jgi:hypothetical protein